jgi:hypothetical protein
MDIVEFAELMHGAKLHDWQKEHLRELDRLRRNGDVRIVMNKGVGRMYAYLNLKELFENGKTTSHE